jgi:hypothetical protein
MSRTVHHVPYKYRDSTRAKEAHEVMIALSGVGYIRRYHLPFSGGEWHSIITLRYSAAVEAVAELGGHRPRPQARLHRLLAYTYPRTHGIGHTVSGPSNRQERGLRAADRAVGREVAKALRAAQDAVQAAWDVEYPEPRHRHFGVWDSW